MNNEERIVKGGSGFHEMQYCAKDLPIKELLRLKNIKNWASDSLYIDVDFADEIFYKYYDKIFSQFGKLSYYGINYFTKEETEKILCDLESQDLPDIKTLSEWPEICVESYNGFYFLGV